VALAHIHLRSAWQAWRLWHGTGSGGAIDLRFAWQAWFLWHWAGSGGVLGRSSVARDAAALCVAGVAFGNIDVPFAWQVWRFQTSTFGLRSRRGTCSHQSPFCVAGVVLGDIHAASESISL